jgi:hypothetical protein
MDGAVTQSAEKGRSLEMDGAVKARSAGYGGAFGAIA